MTAIGLEGNPADWLRRATLADSAGARAKYATRGLEEVGTDRTTRAMLMRQLYLSQLEARRFDDAVSTARAVVQLQVMPDVAYQDCARAELGLGDREAALLSMRRAARLAPATRRSFHFWTLGSLLLLTGRAEQAVDALSRAVRWAGGSRPLYRGHLALAQSATGRAPSTQQWAALRAELAESECGRGYGRFVLGLMAHAQGDLAAASGYLEAFVRRSEGGRVARAVGLSAELEHARKILLGLRV